MKGHHSRTEERHSRHELHLVSSMLFCFPKFRKTKIGGIGALSKSMAFDEIRIQFIKVCYRKIIDLVGFACGHSISRALCTELVRCSKKPRQEIMT